MVYKTSGNTFNPPCHVCAKEASLVRVGRLWLCLPCTKTIARALWYAAKDQEGEYQERKRLQRALGLHSIVPEPKVGQCA